MKKVFLVFTVALATITSSLAQTKTAQETLLQSYYELKDALVAGKSQDAATDAKNFADIVKGADHSIIAQNSASILAKEAEEISTTNDIKKQRDVFADLSKNMISVIHGAKFSSKPVYKQYCPMKKAYWLSSEKAIKNPYYGNSMLTCGRVEGTIE